MAEDAPIPESTADRETAAALYEQAVCDALIAALEQQIARLHGELLQIRSQRRHPARTPAAGPLHGRPSGPAAMPGSRTAA